MNICEYGCGQEAKYKLKNEKWCCEENYIRCSFIRQKISKTVRGLWTESLYRNKLVASHINPNVEIREKFRKAKLGKKRKPFTLETRQKIREAKIGSKNPMFGKRPSEKSLMVSKQKMLDGQAVWMNKFIKNPSKPQLELLKIIQQICPYVEYNYPIYKVGQGKVCYNIDITVPKLELAIEFDGWHHFKDREAKEYHNKRQIEIEQEGWKFLRYNIFQKFPTKDEIAHDILKIVGR
jgi:hypothetical protein